MPGRRARSSWPRHARAPAAPARARRGAPLRDHPPPHAARPRDDDVGARRPAGHRARRASGRCSSTSARPRRCSPQPRGARGRARAAGQDRARDLRPPAPHQRLGAGDAVPGARAISGPGDHRAGQPAERRGARSGRRADGARRCRLAARGPRRHHRLLRRRQVDGDAGLRGRRLLLRRQPAAGDDPRARRAVPARGLEGRARRRRLRRARRRVLRGAAARCSRSSTRAGVRHRVLFLDADERDAAEPLQGDAAPPSARARRAASRRASPPSARCSSRSSDARRRRRSTRRA